MDLKFTFSKTETQPTAGKPLPFNVSNTASSELLIRITQTDAEFTAQAVSPDGNEYAKQTAISAKSALARAIAELDEKLASAVTRLELPTAIASEFTAAGFISANAETTEQLQLRAGINAGTPVKLVTQ